MSTSYTIRFSAWLLIACNVCMALAAIWIFLRMAPAIEVIIEHNSRSLVGTEEMLVNLAMADVDGANYRTYRQHFEMALNQVTNNITEDKEAEVIHRIADQYHEAFERDSKQRIVLVMAIQELAQINHEAMDRADMQARQIGNAGAWGIVVMASIVFATGMVLLRNLKRKVLAPLEEIQTVLHANVTHDPIRRCSTTQAPPELFELYMDLNAVLDKANAIPHT